MSQITIRCRRCLDEISHVEPGALIGCVGCRLITRATLTYQPRTRIICRVVTMGYQVFFVPGLDFDVILKEFKAAVLKNTRGWMKDHWHVAKRAEKRLFAFLDAASARADVVKESETSPASSNAA
jgi:hypothetical protein